MDVLVDTDVVSFGFRFDPLFESFYGPALQGARTVVSFMTVAEVVHASRRQGRTLSTADAWIAATALALDIPLATNNARDFASLDGLRLITAAAQQ